MLQEDEFDFDDDTRIVKWKCKRDFTIIYNDCINDHRLSVESLSILVYVMSKPDDWDIRVGEVSKRFTIGRNKTYSVIKTLIAFGYMKRIRRRNQDGSLGRTSTYASDRPMFLVPEQPLTENQEAVVINSDNKKPFTEFQETVTDDKADKQPCTGNRDMVVIENNDKQPRTGYQHVDIRYVDSLYTNKDFNKENNNNITSNPKGARATPSEDKATDLYPEDSVVVSFMKKIEGSGVPEETLVSWLRKYGSTYVAEKVRIYQTKGSMINPAGFLNSAMRYDWKESGSSSIPDSDNKNNFINFPTNKENQEWFSFLSDEEKNGFMRMAISRHYVFQHMLTNAKVTVLDKCFLEGYLFKFMMELIGRAKR